MDSTPPIENAHRDYELEMELLKRRIASKDSDRMFLWSLMRAAAKRDEGWESAANELADALENPLSGIPLYLPSGLDARRVASESVKFFWPIFMEWREGFVDQSQLHILVRSGGTEIHDDEPEGIDIALVGPDENEQLIVEFLPMIGVDPEAGQAAKSEALFLLDLIVRQGRGNPWDYAKHHCGTASNMYNLVRFMGRNGRKPLEHVDRWVTPGALVTRQVPTTYRLSNADQMVLRNEGDACHIKVSRGDATASVQLLDVSHCSVAVAIWSPFLGGALRRNFCGPYDGGYLIDDATQINERGAAAIADLAMDLALGSARLYERREDLERTATSVRERMETLEESISHEDWVQQIWDSFPRPPSDVDAIVFRSILSDWLRFGCYLFLKSGNEEEGRKLTQNLKSGTYSETEFVRKQLGRVEHLTQSERLRFFEAYDSVAFELKRESGPITGYLMQLTQDSLAVELSVPTRTGCIIRSVRAPDEKRTLIGPDGQLNDFGIQKLIELIDDLQTAVVAMEGRIADIQAAAQNVLERSKSRDAPHDDDEYVMQIWEAVPRPRLGVDVTFFCCIVRSWIWHRVHGLIAPDGWGKAS